MNGKLGQHVTLSHLVVVVRKHELGLYYRILQAGCHALTCLKVVCAILVTAPLTVSYPNGVPTLNARILAVEESRQEADLSTRNLCLEDCHVDYFVSLKYVMQLRVP